MSVLLVSANQLFREVLAETLTQARARLVQADPGNLVATTQRVHPAVIIFGGRPDPATVATLLKCAARFSCCRVIMVDPSCNDLLVVDVRSRSMVRSEDLVEAVREGLAEVSRRTGTRSE